LKLYYALEHPDEDIESLQRLALARGWPPPVSLRGCFGRPIDSQKLKASFQRHAGRVSRVAVELNLSCGTTRRRLRALGLLVAGGLKKGNRGGLT